jgi:hypothetical protein
MFGDGHEPDGPAHQWSIRRRLADGVQFVGLLPNGTLMSRLAQNVDVLVHSSFEEAHCMAIHEEIVFGIPVIGGCIAERFRGFSTMAGRGCW